MALGLIASTAIFILFQTFDTDQYLNRLTTKASAFLGRPVSIGQMSLGLSWNGITLDAGPVIVADDPNFTSQPFIKIDRIRVLPDIASLVLKREMRIKEILFQFPQVHFIRSEAGLLNIQSIMASRQPSVIGGNAPELPTDQSTINSAPAVPIKSVIRDIPVDSIKIQEAAISYIDQSRALPLDIWLNGINLSILDFSLSKPSQIFMEASLYNNRPNVRINASLTPELSSRSAQISNLNLSVDFSKLDMEGFKSISPDMVDNPIFSDITGMVQLKMDELNIVPAGNWAAKGEITITDGIIKDFNIIQAILSRALGFFGNIDGLLSPSLRTIIDAKDTLIKKADAQFSFQDKILNLDDFLLQTDLFELTAKGTVDEGLNMDAQTVLHLNPDISAAMINDFGGLKSFMDDSQRMAISGELKGIIPHLKYKASKDFRKKSRKLLFQEGGNFLKGLF